ncbi:hypothetical protein [Bacillus sp. Bva_UNVM-123]|uniref:hypothetical protein n=1 Tax=Bacillus sp. Bva_UNVM-123 TaxID=2829798 RepID=UPI00391F90CE
MQKILGNDQKFIRFILVFVIFIPLFNYLPNTSFACDCVEPYPVKDELNRSSAVFSGKVVKIEDENKNKLFQSSADPIAVQFEVKETWKGLNQKQILVYTERSSASCGYEFDLNNEYLVFAMEVDGQLKVSLCSRTKLLSAAASDFQELGKGEKPIKDGSIELNENNGEASNTFKTLTSKNTIYITVLILGGILLGVYVFRRVKK